jgi:hypothetical protein
LRKKWKETSNSIENISFTVNTTPDSLSFTQDSLMGTFYKQIVSQGLSIDNIAKSTSIIGVTYKSSDELFAKYFTEALVNNVSSFYIQTKTKRSAANVAILQNRLDSVQVAYNQALYSTAISADENINPARAVVGVPRIKSQANAQILGAEYGELVKNLEVAKMSLLQETPLIQIIDKPILPLKSENLGKLKAIILGIIIGGILTMLGLIIGKFYENVIA